MQCLSAAHAFDYIALRINPSYVLPYTVFIRIEAWAFISYKRLLTRHLYEPIPHFI